MVMRRDFLRWSILAGSAAVAGLSAGGPRSRGDNGITMVGGADHAQSSLSRAVADPAAAAGASEVVRAFTADLYRQLSSSAGNLVCSPYSAVVALAMTSTGARGRTGTEMQRVLHSPDVPALNRGLGAVEAMLEQRSGTKRRADGSSARIELHVANSLWGQRGFAWRRTFLDALARSYGAGMRLVDYRNDPEAARSQINTWTNDQTAGKIDQLLPEGVLDTLTRLVLVNALYLKAPWERPFEKSRTEVLPFRRADGSTVAVPTMRSDIPVARYARGDGWEAAELRYADNGLAMTVVLPDRGTLPAMERNLDAENLTRMLRSPAHVGAIDIQLPTWTFRSNIPLKDCLIALGMPSAFDARVADFSGMTTEAALFIEAVLQAAFIAVDEAGTEAAAATAFVISAVSARPTPIRLIVDRPFLFVIHDIATATPVFIGRVADPS